MISSELVILLLPNLVWWCTITSWNVLRKKIAVFKVRVTAKVQNIIECFSGQYLVNFKKRKEKKANLVVMHHHEPECLTKGLVCYHQGQVHSEGSNNQNTIISPNSLEVLILLQPNLVWWYIIMSWSVLWKVAVFKVKVTVMVHNFIECLSVLYFLYHWYLCNQIMPVYVLLLNQT